MARPPPRDSTSIGCGQPSLAARRTTGCSTSPTAPTTRRSGPLTVIVTPRGLVRLSYPRRGDRRPARRARRSRLAAHPGGARADRCRPPPARRVLRRSAPSFDVPIDWRLVRGFAGDVLRATARIPFGSVSSYRRDCRGGRVAERVPRGRQRARLEPGADRGAVPPGAPRRRRVWAATPAASIASGSCSASRACSTPRPAARRRARARREGPAPA